MRVKPTGRTRRAGDKAFAGRWRRENRSWFETYSQTIINVLICIVVTLFIVIAYVLIQTHNQSQLEGSIGINGILKPNNLINPLINPNIAKKYPVIPQFPVVAAQNRLSEFDRNHIPSLTTPYGHIKLSYRLYKNPICNDNVSDSEYFTVSIDANMDQANPDNPCPTCHSFCDASYPDGTKIQPHSIGSIRILSGDGELDIYEDCGMTRYHASIYPFDKCVRMYSSMPTRGIKVVSNTLKYPQPQPKPFTRQQLAEDTVAANVDENSFRYWGPPMQPHLLTELKEGLIQNYNDCPSYLIVYSCESSTYFGYQTQANYYGFLTSRQAPNAKFLRLLTSSKIDDISSYVPTYTIKRHPYSRRYQPLNKGDSIQKWYESPLFENTLQGAEIIVVIDPDNWLIRDVSKFVKRVKKGHPLGEAAWFHGNPLVTQLWKEVCLKNCDFELDLVGVPYFIHKDDLKEISKYFKQYILILKDIEEKDPNIRERYKNIQMGWGTEMFGYIFAAAHVGIKHEVIRGAQIRDVSERLKTREEELGITMIHVGRIWFPWEYEFAKKWWHTEGRAWKRFGAQVWCKCNFTASEIIPWPIPDGTDFQSRHTLFNLYQSRQYFGEFLNCEMRHKGQGGYGRSYP